MLHLHFFDTDEFDVLSRWELVRNNVTYHYNCDKRTPAKQEVIDVYRRYFTSIGILNPTTAEQLGLRMTWGYDA